MRASWSMALLASLVGAAGCTLVTSPGDFTIVDASADATSKPTKDAADATDDSMASCTMLVDTSQCGVCVAKDCCATLLACHEDPSCVALLKCGVGDTACAKDNAKGLKHETEFLECTTRSCPICAKAGVGDPCTPDEDECEKGLTCTGEWCSKSCVGDGDCAGLSANGTNSSGGQNRCAINAQRAAACFPGCGGNGDCAAFAGTECLQGQASAGGNTNVCSVPAGDAGDP